VSRWTQTATARRILHDVRSLLRRTAIEKLRAHNAHLTEELRTEQRERRRAEHTSAQTQISKLQDACDTYTRKIELERRRIDVRSGLYRHQILYIYTSNALAALACAAADSYLYRPFCAQELDKQVEIMQRSIGEQRQKMGGAAHFPVARCCTRNIIDRLIDR